jgi:hypothetical protein
MAGYVMPDNAGYARRPEAPWIHPRWRDARSLGDLLARRQPDAKRGVRPGEQVGTWKTFDRSGAVVSEKDFPHADI